MQAAVRERAARRSPRSLERSGADRLASLWCVCVGRHSGFRDAKTSGRKKDGRKSACAPGHGGQDGVSRRAKLFVIKEGNGKGGGGGGRDYGGAPFSPRALKDTIHRLNAPNGSPIDRSGQVPKNGGGGEAISHHMFRQSFFDRENSFSSGGRKLWESLCRSPVR